MNTGRGTTKELSGFISAVLMAMFFFATLETLRCMIFKSILWISNCVQWCVHNTSDYSATSIVVYLLVKKSSI